MKKAYQKPTIVSEEIRVGVFGSYGSTGGNTDWWGSFHPIAIINPLFHICCS